MTSKILIVDDDPLAFITMESIFDGQPYQLIPAYSGPSALEKAGEIMPDLILLDVCLLYTSPSPRDRTRSRMPSSA